MSDQDFQNRVLEYFDRLEEQRREDNLRLEKQRTEDNLRLEKRLDAIAEQAKEDNLRLEKRLDAIKIISDLAVDVGWIKGKLEAKGEERTAIIAKIAVGTAICSAIIAVIGLFF